MERLHEKIKDLNKVLFNPVGLNILWPRKVAFLFVGIISPFFLRLGRLTDNYLTSPGSLLPTFALLGWSFLGW